MNQSPVTQLKKQFLNISAYTAMEGNKIEWSESALSYLSGLLHFSSVYNKRNLFERRCEWIAVQQNSFENLKNVINELNATLKDPYLEALAKITDQNMPISDTRNFFRIVHSLINNETALKQFCANFSVLTQKGTELRIEKIREAVAQIQEKEKNVAELAKALEPMVVTLEYSLLYTLLEGIPFEYGLILIEGILTYFGYAAFAYSSLAATASIGFAVGMMSFLSPFVAKPLTALLTGKDWKTELKNYWKAAVDDDTSFHPLVECALTGLALMFTWHYAFKFGYNGHRYFYPALKFCMQVKHMIQNQLYASFAGFKDMIRLTLLTFIRGCIKDEMKPMMQHFEKQWNISSLWIGDVFNTIQSEIILAWLIHKTAKPG